MILFYHKIFPNLQTSSLAGACPGGSKTQRDAMHRCSQPCDDKAGKVQKVDHQSDLHTIILVVAENDS